MIIKLTKKLRHIRCRSFFKILANKNNCLGSVGACSLKQTLQQPEIGRWVTFIAAEGHQATAVDVVSGAEAETTLGPEAAATSGAEAAAGVRLQPCFSAGNPEFTQ